MDGGEARPLDLRVACRLRQGVMSKSSRLSLGKDLLSNKKFSQASAIFPPFTRETNPKTSLPAGHSLGAEGGHTLSFPTHFSLSHNPLIPVSPRLRIASAGHAVTQVPAFTHDNSAQRDKPKTDRETCLSEPVATLSQLAGPGGTSCQSLQAMAQAITGVTTSFGSKNNPI